jgi:hypothetical protein
MGDGFTTIRAITKVRNRVVRSEKGAGARVCGGTKVVIRNAGIPAIMISGIHAGSEKNKPPYSSRTAQVLRRWASHTTSIKSHRRLPEPVPRTNKSGTLYLHCGFNTLKMLNLWRCEDRP